MAASGGRPRGSLSATTLAKRAARARALEAAGVTAAQAIAETARIAFADIRQCFAADGHLLAVGDLRPEVAAAVASVKTLKTNVLSGDGQQEVTRELKLCDKVRALELLLRHFGELRDRTEVSGGLTVDLIETLRRRTARLETDPPRGQSQ